MGDARAKRPGLFCWAGRCPMTDRTQSWLESGCSKTELRQLGFSSHQAAVDHPVVSTSLQK